MSLSFFFFFWYDKDFVIEFSIKRFIVPYISLLHGNLLFKHSQNWVCTYFQNLYQQILNLPLSVLPLDCNFSVGWVILIRFHIIFVKVNWLIQRTHQLNVLKTFNFVCASIDNLVNSFFSEFVIIVVQLDRNYIGYKCGAFMKFWLSLSK